MKVFKIEELKGKALNNAIKNMQLQLLEDNNEIKKIEDITLERIFAEIDSVGILFSDSGEIILI
jgi:hypothetical protein